RMLQRGFRMHALALKADPQRRLAVCFVPSADIAAPRMRPVVHPGSCLNFELRRPSSVIKGAATASPPTPWWLPSFTGLFLGFLFFVLTFTPSLVPRPPIFQGLLGGLAFFIGYTIGHGGGLLLRFSHLPWVLRAR